MAAARINVGDKVAKGFEVYAVLTEPTIGIFTASDDKGRTVTLSVREAVTLNESPPEPPPR